MLNILREPDDMIIRISNGKQLTDASVRFERKGRKLEIYLIAQKDEPEFLCLRWNGVIENPVRVMGDKWERSYADLSWRSLSGEDFMPWYFMANDGSDTVGYGVMVQPGSFVSFQHDSKGITGWFDVRCGAAGVRLNGRELHVATVVCETYSGISAFEATQRFCRVMSPNPILPDKPVYGSNNWYYAYGKSSGEEIRRDAALIAELAGDNENKPFMVVDDGWTPNPVCGPWIPNEAYGDMKKIADDFKSMGVRPGIWIRLLHDTEAESNHPEWRIKNGKNGDRLWQLDPSHPEVKKYLREVLERVRGWGYELSKHDFSTYDMFGEWGSVLNGMITDYGSWHFYDRGKTSAEIVLDFYRLIREATEGMMILGCCTIPHLCAGLVELNRIGDDTSGKAWSRTRAIGVNTLAFRLPQNGSFYAVDADCVGILEDNIPWSLNKQWLELLASSGTPLFVSAQPDALTDEMKADLKLAFAVNSLQSDNAIPADWMYNNTPDIWLINGEEKRFDWIGNSYPALTYKRIQP